MNARVLVIEDDPISLRLMSYLLRSAGCLTLTAADGEAGLRVASAERPDLVLCDIQLPKVDGFGVVAAITTDPQLRSIPVVAVTALAMVGDRERIMRAGFSGYVSKPIEPMRFIEQIEAFLSLASSTQTAATPDSSS